MKVKFLIFNIFLFSKKASKKKKAALDYCLMLFGADHEGLHRLFKEKCVFLLIHCRAGQKNTHAVILILLTHLWLRLSVKDVHMFFQEGVCGDKRRFHIIAKKKRKEPPPSKKNNKINGSART